MDSTDGPPAEGCWRTRPLFEEEEEGRRRIRHMIPAKQHPSSLNSSFCSFGLRCRFGRAGYCYRRGIGRVRLLSLGTRKNESLGHYF